MYPSSSSTSQGSIMGHNSTNEQSKLKPSSSSLQISYSFNDLTIGQSSSSSSLVHHTSSPARFFNQLADDNGLSVSMGIGSHHSRGAPDGGCGGTARLDNTQLSFTRQEADDFTVNGLNSTEIQFQFGMSQTALQVGTIDRRCLNIPEDSVTCKIRAKNGCATHPRSIAERERRTRISGKLKKLQDLVPNMDKQTSYADMLDLAVQHIRSLQHRVQKLNKELDNCKCGCKNSTH